MTNNLSKCVRCQKICIDEEFQNHTCIPEPTGMKKIKIAYHFTTKDIFGNNVIEAKDLDGVTYQMIEIPEDKEHTKIPYQPKVNTNNNSREDNSTHKIKSYILGYFIVR